MSMDENYSPKPRSMQTELSGLGAKGEATAVKAREWIAANSGAWNYITDNALRLARRDGRVSARYLVDMARTELRVSIPNNITPVLARILADTIPELAAAFRMHKSDTDGFVGGEA